ncbi:hypothetical protein [Leuconostoc pseudomesenteroides]|uniref:hypothetical protein n=1 Tax=Leuconostoc pseudomesenteroides TaxID=33968 RepID=UPI0039ED8894
MTTKKHNKRKAQLTKYIEQLDEFNWHHPTQVSDMADSQFERDQTNYYLAQLSHVLINNYPVSYNSIGQMLNIDPKKVKRLMTVYSHDFTSIKQVEESLLNRGEW